MNQKNSVKNFWLFSPGERSGKWDEFYEKGFIAIGWEFLGDISKYKSREEIDKKIKEYYSTESSKVNVTSACYEFAFSLKPGDVVVVKEGLYNYIGYGIVDSDYIFDESQLEFKSIRKIKWVKKGNWKIEDHHIVVKTLTNITGYTDYLQRLRELIGIKEIEPAPIISGLKQYWWLNSNPNYWSFTEYKPGDTLSYPIFNEKGHKRSKFNYFSMVQTGDIIIGFVSEPQNEITTICEVSKPLINSPNNDSIEIRIIEHLGHPVPYKNLFKLPDLKECEPVLNNYGSIFKLTDNEYDTLTEYIDSINPPVKITSEKFSVNDALNDLFIPKDKFKDILQVLKQKKNIILDGPPGVGKTFVAKRLAFALLNKIDHSKVEEIQFHDSYTYDEFVQGYKPTEYGGMERVNGIFFQFCKRAQIDPEENYFFIINEINRGRLSEIFGELITLIEPDKRGKEFAIPLMYTKSTNEKFFIPENVFLIGTMCNADTAPSWLDINLRRRFSFIKIEPAFNSVDFINYLLKKGVKVSVVEHMKNEFIKLNKLISDNMDHLGEDYRIGHSYFCQNGFSKEYYGNEIWYNKIIETDIAPIIKFYWTKNREEANKLISDLRMNNLDSDNFSFK